MNLSKKHLKQIYRRRNGFGGTTVMLSKFFHAAPNNRADYNKMMDWRWSMCTNVRYMIPGEKIKRGKKVALRHEGLVKSAYFLNAGLADLGATILDAMSSIDNFTSNLRGAFEK
ncbi:hypothetical protein [Faecalibacterium sp. AF10-46]|uniref:hypothetical protein n=1 Tax=Faecalibacterium sp. AF10-46 TaxID=2302955 RepID=UPI000E7714DB|nr:hypothetical protein [Faecalibacterium sp. AF10-46]RJW79098.1 hypothetical protein DWV57_05875 [Faecalibacterium sp. AF10-46]